jgi:hypothetical protein
MCAQIRRCDARRQCSWIVASRTLSACCFGTQALPTEARRLRAALIRVFLSALFGTLLGSFSALAADIEAAKDAYRRGDDAKAAALYAEVARRGDPEAQYLLGKMYDYGQGVEQDYAEALRWYRAAAEQGYAKGQRNLGVLYARGYGVARDVHQSIEWLKKASAGGDDWAPTLLGMIYASGDGVLQDNTEAAKWYRLGANRANQQAQFVLGVLYARGEGVAQDNVQAYMWLNLAGVKGAREALEARDMVAERMTREEILEAHRLTREWQPQ